MHNISKGSIGELKAKAKFLERGMSVFEDEVDIRGTDFIALPYTDNPEPLKIQVKAVDSSDKSFRVNKDTSADYYCFINSTTEDFWIVPKSEEKKIISSAKNPENLHSMLFELNAEEWEDFEGFSVLSDLIDLPEFHASRRGRVGENYGIAFLLEQGLEVYEPLNDINGIDAVIEYQNEKFNLQIKYTSTDEHGLSFRNVDKREPSEDYLFLFVVGEPREFYLIPSKAVEDKSSKTGGIYLNQEYRDNYDGINYLESSENEKGNKKS